VHGSASRSFVRSTLPSTAHGCAFFPFTRHSLLLSAAIYVAEEAQRAMPGRVKAVVALAPTVGDIEYGEEQFALRAHRLTTPLLMTAGRNDGAFI
jgi:hypothetical protein|tara:strand:+ start:770 stop:1054 length:285 start_codon:yes stop_codon:yes gene_type:complete